MCSALLVHLRIIYKDQYMVAKLKNQHSLSRKRLVPILAPYISADPIAALEDLFTKTEQRIFYHVVKFTNFTHHICPSQITIAKNSGFCRKTVNETLGKFKELGFISWNRRFNNSNIYHLHPMFWQPTVRKSLRFMFKTFYFLNIAILYGHQPLPGQIVPQEYIFSGRLQYKEIRNIYIYDRAKAPTSKDRISSGSDQKTKNLNARRGVKMEPKDLKRIKSLNLTKAGAIKLSAFPPEAWEYALTEIRKHDKPISDLFKFTWILCKRYCEANNVFQNHREVSRTLKREGVGFEEDGLVSTAPCVLEPLSLVDTKPKNGMYATFRGIEPRPQISVEREVEARQELIDMANSGNEWAKILLG